MHIHIDTYTQHTSVFVQRQIFVQWSNNIGFLSSGGGGSGAPIVEEKEEVKEKEEESDDDMGFSLFD